MDDDSDRLRKLTGKKKEIRGKEEGRERRRKKGERRNTLWPLGLASP